MFVDTRFRRKSEDVIVVKSRRRLWADMWACQTWAPHGIHLHIRVPNVRGAPSVCAGCRKWMWGKYMFF
jgi:hypothetical protein